MFKMTQMCTIHFLVPNEEKNVAILCTKIVLTHYKEDVICLYMNLTIIT